MHMKRYIFWAISGLLIGASAGMAETPVREELIESMRLRYPQLEAAKQRGEIGEAWTGLTGVVDPAASAETRAMVEQENQDRRNLFAIIARETNSTVDEVARQNRIRMYRLAGAADFVQDAQRRWVRRSELP
jgi:uncharacterized protein